MEMAVNKLLDKVEEAVETCLGSARRFVPCFLHSSGLRGAPLEVFDPGTSKCLGGSLDH